MSVYKEIGYLVRKIENNSVRIYELIDAADYGMPVESLEDDILKEVKSIMELYGLEAITERYATGFTQTITFDGGVDASIEAGFSNCVIEFVSCDKKGMIGYLVALPTNNDGCMDTDTAIV